MCFHLNDLKMWRYFELDTMCPRLSIQYSVSCMQPENTDYHVYNSASMSPDSGLERLYYYVLIQLMLDAFYTESEAGPYSFLLQ